MPGEIERYRLIYPYHRRLNAIQFGASLKAEDRAVRLAIDPQRPLVGYVEPTITFEDEHKFEVGGVQIDLYHTVGETLDHLMVWLPETKTLCPGDLFYPSFPMLSSPMKHDRPVLKWAESIERMVEMEPHYLVPSHVLPFSGAEQIKSMLGNYARAIRHVHDETIAGLNEGLPLADIRGRVELPPDLADLPYLRELYGRIDWAVNGIYRQYTGWYDMQPAHLAPAPEADVQRALVEAAGGPESIIRRASQALEDDRPQIALELSDVVIGAGHDAGDVRAVRQAALERLAKTATNTVARNIYRAAAAEQPSPSTSTSGGR